MLAHLRSNLSLVVLTMLVGVVAFPAVLLAFGQVAFPHITEANARMQLPRVVAGWVKRTGKKEAEVKPVVEAALVAGLFRPLFGLVGQEPIVNVLELNLELARRCSSPAPGTGLRRAGSVTAQSGGG